MSNGTISRVWNFPCYYPILPHVSGTEWGNKTGNSNLCISKKSCAEAMGDVWTKLTWLCSPLSLPTNEPKYTSVAPHICEYYLFFSWPALLCVQAGWRIINISKWGDLNWLWWKERWNLARLMSERLANTIVLVLSQYLTYFVMHDNFFHYNGTIWQSCDNVVAMLGFWSKYKVGTTFTQRCLDVHTMLLGCLKVSTFEWCRNVGTDIETTFAPILWQRCHRIGALAG